MYLPKGQVVIPQDVRKLLGIHPGDTVIIKATRHHITMEKAESAPKAKLKIVKGEMPIIKIPRSAGPLTLEMVKEIAQL